MEPQARGVPDMGCNRKQKRTARREIVTDHQSQQMVMMTQTIVGGHVKVL